MNQQLDHEDDEDKEGEDEDNDEEVEEEYPDDDYEKESEKEQDQNNANGQDESEGNVQSIQNKEEQEEQENDHQNTKKTKGLKFDLLTGQSLRVIYNMTDYIGENEPEDLFYDFIFEQLIKTRKSQNMLELINADDFFNVLEEHGVMRKATTKEKKEEQEKIKENIKEFLCLDPQYKDLLMMKKINRAWKEITENEELKKKARQYESSVGDEEYTVEEGEVDEEIEEEIRDSMAEDANLEKNDYKNQTIPKKLSPRSKSILNVCLINSAVWLINIKSMNLKSQMFYN